MCAAIAVGGLTSVALAQVPDPTRPPTAAGLATGATPEGGIVAGNENAVQAVFVRPGGKSTAIVNGQTIRIGDPWGDKRVIRISEKEIVLRGDGGRESIPIYPGIEKSMVPVKRASSVDESKSKGAR